MPCFLTVFTLIITQNGTVYKHTQIHHVLHPLMIFANSQDLLGLGSWDTRPSNKIISHWNLECASTFIIGLPQSSLFIGCFFGFSFLAALADSSFGQKNMLIFSCVLMSITYMLKIFSTNVWIYSALAFLHCHMCSCFAYGESKRRMTIPG